MLHLVKYFQENILDQKKGQKNLVAAVGAGHVDDQPEFPCSVVDILPLELSQLCLGLGVQEKCQYQCSFYLVGPGESFIRVDCAIEGT